MQTIGLLKHKIVPPKPQKYYINRRRLIELLDNGKAHGVLAIAPAGYGKTALVSQFYSNLPRNMKCWLNLDSEDSEPARFIQYFIGALARQIKSLESSGLVEKANHAEVRLSDIAEDVALYFEKYKGPPIWFTLDNWERVNNNEDICNFAEKLVGIPDSRMRIIVNSRVKPEFRFQRNQEIGNLTVITKDDLRFTRAELSSAIEKRTGIALDKKRLDEFHKATGGWCVIAGLLRERIAGTDLMFDLDKLTDADELEDYLLQEVFSSLDAELFRFLIQCSLLDTLSRESCQIVISDQKLIGRCLKEITRSNLPCSIIEKDVVRLHPIIRKSLTESLKKTYQESLRNDVYYKVVDYYVKIGDADLAIELLFDIGAYKDAFATIKMNWHILMSQNKVAKVGDWLNRTPASLHDLPDYLIVFTDFHNELGNFGAIITRIGPLLQSDRLENGSDTLGILWSRYHKCLGIMEYSNHYDHYVRLWKKFERSRGPFGPAAMLSVHDMLGFVSYSELKFDKTNHHARKALSYIGKNDVHRQEEYNIKIQYGDHLQGDSAKVVEAYSKVLSSSSGSEPRPFPFYQAMFLCMALTEMGQYEKALNVIRRCRETMGEFRFFEEFNRLLFDRCEGICRFHLGNVSQGLSFLERAVRYAKDYLPPYFISSAIIYNYYRSLANEPVDYSTIPKFEDQPVVREESFYAGILQSYRSIKERDFPEARRWLRQIESIAEKNGNAPWIMVTSFWEAFLNEKSGNRKPIKAQVRKGAEILNRIKWSSFPMINSELISFLIPCSIVRDIKIDCINELKGITHLHDLQVSFDYFLSKKSLTNEQRLRLIRWATEHEIGNLTRIIKKYTNSANGQLGVASKRYADSAGSFPLPPMVVNTLGDYSINIDGRIIRFSRKKSRLLFSILLANHPNPVHEEELIDILLSGKQISDPKSNIRTIASSVRKSLLNDSEGSTSYLVYSNNVYSLRIPNSLQSTSWR